VTSAEDTKCPGYTSVGKMYENMDQMKAPVLGQQKDHYCEVANMSGSFTCGVSMHFQRQTQRASDCRQVCAPPAPVE